MERNEFYVESEFDGLPVSVLEMLPESKPRAVVYMVHGLCGCKERFIPFMEYLAADGIACVASDHRGHGGSILKEEDRGYMYNGGAQAVVMDMDIVVHYIKDRFHGIPLVLVGHSMGSLAARAYVKLHDIKLDGLVICGSPTPNPLASVGRVIIRGLCRRDNGRSRPAYLQSFTSSRYNRRFRNEGSQAWTCSDPSVRRAFADDLRCNFKITADCASTLMELFHETYARQGWNSRNPGLHVIFLSGEDDPCMISQKKFFRSVNQMRLNGYTDVRCRTYAGMRHEILNEVDKLTVWQDIIDYIDTVVL